MAEQVRGGQCGANSLRVDKGTHPCTLAFASNRFKHMNSAQSAMLLPNTCRQRTCASSANRTRVASLDGMQRKEQKKENKKAGTTMPALRRDGGTVRAEHRQADPGWHLGAPVGRAETKGDLRCDEMGRCDGM
jgi:hypothetical protein